MLRLQLRPPPWTLLLAAALCNAMLLLFFLLASPDDVRRTCPTLIRNVQYHAERLPIALATHAGGGSGYMRVLLQVATGIYTGSNTRLDAAPPFHLERHHGQVGHTLVVATANLTYALSSEVEARKVVHLVRNPFAQIVAAFLLTRAGDHYRRSRTLKREDWERFVLHAAHAWRRHARYWLQLRRDETHPYMLVHYEDLFSSSSRRATLDALLKFLDVEAPAKRLMCAMQVRLPVLRDFMELFSNAQRRWLMQFTRVERALLGYNFSVPLSSRVDYIVPGESDMGHALHCRPSSVFSRSIRQLHARLAQTREHSRHSESRTEREQRLNEAPLVLSWNRDDWMGWLKQESFFSEWQGVNITKHASKCRWSRDRDELKRATVVLFSAIRHQNTHQERWCDEPHELPTWRGHWQRWGAVNYETPQQFSLLNHEGHAALYDWRVGWEKHADFAISMNCPFPTSRSLTDAPPRKEPTHVAAYFASRCIAEDRDAYVAQLMQYMEVHSYGACLNNRRLPEDEERRWPRNWGAKIATLSTYYFALAFENGEFEHWVTEKMPQAIYAGTVPVYWGAPDVQHFAPGPHSVIRTADFASPRELAAYLVYLTKNSTAYEEYFAWKQGPISAGWQEHRNNCAFFAQEKICDAAIELQRAEREGKLQVDKEERPRESSTALLR